MKTIHLIAATRPNFMKVAPLWHALSSENDYTVKLVHTGQHYDYSMSQLFFDELKLPEPSVNLQTGSGSHATQTAAVMVAYEKYLLEQTPDVVVVPGDVNSTLACALTSVKMHIPVAHLEAGLRSRDKTMPEEINRVLTDAISSICWTPSEDASENLLQEGVEPNRISFVGNCMIDSLNTMMPAIQSRRAWEQFDIEADTYCVVTLHRPGNVDDPTRLKAIINALMELSVRMPLVLPLHPRTRQQLDNMGMLPTLEQHGSIHIIPPQGYLDFTSLMHRAALVITDSGGLQEETTILGIPCLTIRPNTERPITCTEGTNRLVEPDSITSAADDALGSGVTTPRIPTFWDGKTAQRIVTDLNERFANNRVDNG
ncbi:non-hydrolyzing UDP-N-acetylglucosamine 2-epimerase [Pseudodesulfovibrio sediminis]|uniref:UDP-N-acetylglucosamine 2-epimerase (Non-hydrolyzing) n=1 Tax=Pseudodesulfovibrio sediminis TaxID=2810563 RepID=A0ABN6EUS2_9BACT|nr:UDP-N-acetylglucosamine 2-epimerase (non-hydrolyzing) [Pseudodesulfovibrio sediminis]BCS89207.1 UDP-N-acetylglucosamine 2-epimerase (non-hydrolyzing) [Pseudodesulfovibrio sediminis]